MRAQIVNLNQARKRRERAEAAKKADESAAAHGRSKAEKSLSDARRDKENRDLDGKKREE